MGAAVLLLGAEPDARLIRTLAPGRRSCDDEAGVPSHDPESLRLEPVVAALERRGRPAALQASGDNKVEAARLLGVSERTLWYKLKKYRL